MKNYNELSKLPTEITQWMQVSFTDIFAQYKEHIENHWTTICQEQDIQPLQSQFNQAMHQNINKYWQPVFGKANHLLQDINRMITVNTTK